MKAFVIGAGLAGLSAATALAERGYQVHVLESSAQAGGRCRSYYDGVLEMTLDNGNHLLLSGNRAAFNYLRRIGAEDRMLGPQSAQLDFFDVTANARWTIRPNDGPLPWWLLSRARRTPGTRLTDYAPLARLAIALQNRRVDQLISCHGPLWDHLTEPFLLAALNTPAAEGSAALAGSVIRQSLARGGRAYRPRIATPSLAAAFVDPALTYLSDHGAEVWLQKSVRGLEFGSDRLIGMVVADQRIDVAARDAVVLAPPPWVAEALMPGLATPNAFNAILNGHFRFAAPPGASPIVGVIGGFVQWVFAFEDRLSVTVSAADERDDADRETLARRLWRDVAQVHALPTALPPWRIVKERRATFAATPEQNARRPHARTRWHNLFLAGDWTATGLPATIEGAVRSGETAARLASALV